MEPKKQLTYILLITLLVTSVFFIFLLLRSNQIMSDMNASAQEPEKILIVTTDKVTDQSWGSQAYKGKMKIDNLFNAEVTLESEVNLDVELENIIQQAIQEGTGLIIGHGREFSEIFYKLTNLYKDTQFVTIHGDYTNSNLAVYTFDHQEIEYVAGVAAALKTSSNKIGVIDAVNNEHKDWGFSEGINSIKPEIELMYSVVYSRDDHEKALEIARKMINDGVDIIYTKGNSYNQSVINLAKTEGIYVIGYLEDQAYMAEDYMLTSVLNDVSQVYKAIVNDYFSEEGIPSQKNILNTTDGVYGLAPLGNMFSKEEIVIIENKEQEILSSG
ncbi:transcriptional activator of comK gene [Gracilibacillus ureilyticus]|uniref:Transcriptional activator of comK protein n=1 Tax=Gracilibacillus ureilyticus TaxID=531814 RepID=A0A1H9LV51_9BACI|nr:BMP family ABC transporter substrate-binding protein [Gracilibacillus ureilyticus]SER15321.1 transcriptional activator of comK gene [Gracilibacillus ureilyticus]